jgi:hypothetical protein
LPPCCETCLVPLRAAYELLRMRLSTISAGRSRHQFDLDEPAAPFDETCFGPKILTMRIQFARNAQGAKRSGKPVFRRATVVSIEEGKLFINV